MRYKLIINYIGTDFVGWQHQRGGGSIQDSVEDAIFRLTGERAGIFASGRTDAGVHALAQVAHFDLNKPFEPRKIAAGLNFYLPKTIRVQHAEYAREGFHARMSAKQKTYIYVMYKSTFDNALLLNRALKIPHEASMAKMQEAAKMFLGRHDFQAFMSAGSSAKTTTRTIYDSQIIPASLDAILNPFQQPLHPMENPPPTENVQSMENPNPTENFQPLENSLHPIESNPPLIIYKVTANGFLYNMVRKIAAHILKVGLGKLDPAQIPALIEAKNRALTKDTAKPDGLYLYSVEYKD